MKVKITQQIKDSIHSFKNKTSRSNGYQVYAALYKKSRHIHKDGYFYVPSTYLRDANSRYHRFIQKFIDDGILKIYERIEPGFGGIPDKVYKHYDTNKGYCMKYKFLVDINSGEEMEIEFISDKKFRWYELTKLSLIELGYNNIKIIRDSFGLRVYHNAIRDYRKDLKNKGLMVIDAQCSQPRLLYNLMKDANIIDTNYFSLFENTDKNDFYDFIIMHFGFTGDEDESRDKAKSLFTKWVFGKGYTDGHSFYKVFPVASAFVKSLKKSGYKKSSYLMQRIESKVWIDDILENIEVDFAIPIHDSIIVKAKDADKALLWCTKRHPKIVFTLKDIKEKKRQIKL